MARHPWLRRPRHRILDSRGSSIQSLPYFQSVEPNNDERWDLFVARAAAETLAYLRSTTSKFSDEGNVYVNVAWVNEAQFRNLKL